MSRKLHLPTRENILVENESALYCIVKLFLLPTKHQDSDSQVKIINIKINLVEMTSK